MALIYDIGAHKGEDTDYYLKKGFSVIAVEAFPEHADALRERFGEHLRSGALTIEQVAIGTETRTGPFLVHSEVSEWNRAVFDPNHPSARSGTFREVELNFVSPSDLFRKHGVPYYLKVDIEGNDWIVIKAISADFAPDFVSFEECNQYPELIAHLAECGYRSIQIIDQSRHRLFKQRQTDGEGPVVNISFKHGMTGPFGFDLPDRWMDLEPSLRLIPHLSYSRKKWYDFHLSLHPNRFGRLVRSHARRAGGVAQQSA